MQDARTYKERRNIAWPVLVDDLEGTVHQVYSGLADPTYLIDIDGRVSYFNMWTHAPNLYEAIGALLMQGRRGVVNGGIDHVMHLLPTIADGWRGLELGVPQSFTDLETAAPGMASGPWLGYQLRPLLAPITLREKPLPRDARIALGIGAAAIAFALLQRSRG